MMTSDDQREALTDLMGSIGCVLADIPCPECRRSAEQYVKTETPRFVPEECLWQTIRTGDSSVINTKLSPDVTPPP